MLNRSVDTSNFDRAIKHAKEARKTHKEWAKHIKDGWADEDEIALIGSRKHHLKWVEHYDDIILLLRECQVKHDHRKTIPGIKLDD